MNRSLGIFGVFMVVLFSFGCQPKAVFTEVKTIENGIWHHDEILNFEPTINDTTETYDVGIFIDHMKDYPFENLYISFGHAESGESQTDTITLDLVGKDGYFKGNCNSESCSLEKVLLSNIRFQNTGLQTFSLEQFTRNESLEGINEIGVFIRKTVNE
jgi:gliding motility-associated lipoprotein GldH